LDVYISKDKKDGETFPERAWDAVSELACPKVKFDIADNDALKSFHKFGCAISQCTHSPKWNAFISRDEFE
jgi:hypothetical protein